jgi:hypothetical protein
MSSYPILGDVNFDHLVNVRSARFLHSKVMTFPSEIKSLRRYFQIMQISHCFSDSLFHDFTIDLY